MSPEFLISCVIAYLIGSVNSAIIFCKLFKLPDPRTKGSKNPGATNVYRIGGKKAAVVVVFFDVFKGVIPTWGSYFYGLVPMEIGFVAVSCCLGHMYPVFFGFKGGKAVATALGCLLPVGLSIGGSLLLAWGITFKLSGYSSLSAIVAVSISPIATYFISPKYVIPVTMLAILIIVRHLPNILRLLAGTEPKSNLRL